MRPARAALLTLLVLLLRPGPAVASAAAGGVLIVSPDGPYTSIPSALQAAHPGDTIEVRGGVYPGGVVVDKSVRLIGRDRPVLDGGGTGTVVTLSAPGIVFQGFDVRGSGREPDRDHAGITLTAAHIRVEDNRVEDALFGIFVAQADDAVVRGNTIRGAPELDPGRRGDGIRVWYSARPRVEGNLVQAARDVVVWYSPDLVLAGNEIRDGRYGVHLMYCDRARIEDNRLEGNSVGIFIMYSHQSTLLRNLVRGQRGPSGYGLGFKDAEDVEAAHNVLADNRVGIYLDGTPFSPQSFARFSDNLLAFNDVGVLLLPAVRGNVFAGNTLWENVEQVGLQGGGAPGVNLWSGNVWSDYAGFDADGDGRGDVPYRAERGFEGLIDREPRLRMLLYSPAAQAIEMAAATFPVLRPQPKLTDGAPAIQPAGLPAFVPLPAGDPLQLGGVSLGLLGAGLLALAGARPPRAAASVATPTLAWKNAPDDGPFLSIVHLAKRYGRQTALDDVTFHADRGQAIALWGSNGAGKTTLLKAVLGLIDVQGEITLHGYDVRRQGKRARGLIGYVAQDTVFDDLPLRELMAFYARLRRVPEARIDPLIARLGLAEHARKPVPALSGGLKQRLALGLALLSDPPLLVLDEPTASLDDASRREYLALLRSLLRTDNRTILFASHRLEEIEFLADRVLILEAGRLREEATLREFMARFGARLRMTIRLPEADHPRALALFQQSGWPAGRNGHGTVHVVLEQADKPRALQAILRAGLDILDVDFSAEPPWS